ncbi:MAG: carboxymuconolactone decarboxylase family protein, partial [Actinomycetota bacterium]|nr:carboxymuconolactone decarboxylase family protein [Actinomycetota bacterium]
MSTRSRLPGLRPPELDDAQRGVYSAITDGARGHVPTAPDGSLAGPFNAMVHAPWVGDALQELGAALRTRGRLPARTRELAVLAVAAHHR